MLVGALALVLVDFLLLDLGAKDTSRNWMIPWLPEPEQGGVKQRMKRVAEVDPRQPLELISR